MDVGKPKYIWKTPYHTCCKVTQVQPVASSVALGEVQVGHELALRQFHPRMCDYTILAGKVIGLSTKRFHSKQKTPLLSGRS